MKLKVVSPNLLSNRYDRACAKLAKIALNDTITGNARALILSKRLQRIDSDIPANDIVSDVYSLSNWTCGAHWSAFECPECGQACLGQEAALACCAQDDFQE